MKVSSVVLVSGSAWVPPDVFAGSSKRQPAEGVEWVHEPGERSITVLRGSDIIASIPASACLVINYEQPKRSAPAPAPEPVKPTGKARR